MKHNALPVSVRFVLAFILTLGACHASVAAIAVQKLKFQCDNNTSLEAVFYWNPDQVRITMGDLIVLLPARKTESRFDFADTYYQFYSTGKTATLVNLKTGKHIECAVKRR